MFEALVLLVMLFAALPILGWLMGLAFRLFGWTIRTMIGLLLAPIFIIGLIVSGAVALLPIALVCIVFSMLVAE